MLDLFDSFVPKTSFLSISRCSRTISNIMPTYLTVDSNRMTKFKDFRHTRTPVGLLYYRWHSTKSCQATHHLMVHVLNHQYESTTQLLVQKRSCRIVKNKGLLFGNRYWTRIPSHTKPNNPFTNKPTNLEMFLWSGLFDLRSENAFVEPFCNAFKGAITMEFFLHSFFMGYANFWGFFKVLCDLWKGHSFGQRFGCIFVACCSFSGLEKPNRCYGPFMQS